MKTFLRIATIAISTGCASAAFAQAKNFEGFSVALNANATSTSVSRQVHTGGGSDGSGPGSYASLQAQYAIALSNTFVLGVGATAALGSYSLGNIYTNTNMDLTQKQQVSVDLLPGYAVSDSTLVYGRLSYYDARSASSGQFGGEEYSTTGKSYGIGGRMMIDKNLFWQVEYSRNVSNDLTTSLSTMKATTSVLSLGVGYKF